VLTGDGQVQTAVARLLRNDEMQGVERDGCDIAWPHVARAGRRLPAGTARTPPLPTRTHRFLDAVVFRDEKDSVISMKPLRVFRPRKGFPL
jgi:hypothetical protein